MDQFRIPLFLHFFYLSCTFIVNFIHLNMFWLCTMCCGVSWHHCATVYVCVCKCATASALQFVQLLIVYFAKVLCKVFWYHNVTAQGPSLNLELCCSLSLLEPVKGGS
jgi:hypothetical protein